MNEIKIESGIPIPGDKSKAKGLTAAIRKMQVGDSIFLEGLQPSHLSGRIQFAKLETGYKLISRTVTENGIKGVRIWRIA